MSTVIDVIPTGGYPLAVVADENLPLDLLNRQEFIDQLMQLLNIISDNRSSSTFALNGTWGVGKTFVLNRLMKQLLDYQDGEKFFVFHYNCWQYDYYEEPLIAIVAAMLDSVDQENHFFSQSLREKAKQGMAVAKPILEKIAKDFIKKKVGVDITDLITFFKDGAEAVEGVNAQEADANDYDKYYSFKKAISSAQDGIRSLSRDRTVVVIVDELDRCLPSYAIKVMERLHHLFAELDNCAVILAVDKGQLDQTVSQIFGSKTDTTKYLKKFIDFEIPLDIGRIECGFSEKYADYFAMFDETLIETSFSFDKYYSALFAGIDVRTQEHMMSRIKTVHAMLFPEVKKDYSFMCFELMWLVFSEHFTSNSVMPLAYDQNGFHVQRDSMPAFTIYLRKEWGQMPMHVSQRSSNPNRIYTLASPPDIPQFLIWYLWQMYQSPRVAYHFASGTPNQEIYHQNLSELKQVADLLKIIK